MDILMIAVVKNGNQKGFRLIDIDNPTDIKVYPEGLVYNGINSGQVKVKNLEVKDGQLVGTNGVIERYAVVDSVKGVVGNSPLVVISQIGNVGYKVVDCNGTIKVWDTAKVVAYAKINGIANGKIVSKNNVEFISSIVGVYPIESLKGSGKSSGKVKNISVGTDTLARNTLIEADNIIDDKDALEVLTEDQRAAIRNYYVWYTVEQYRALAKDIRLNLAPGKLEQLSALKGEAEWEFAGIIDLGFTGGGKCTLGHDLRYAYLAAPSKTKDDRSTWIIFGSGCAGDFFDIPKEEMAKLTRARMEMTEEIKEVTEAISSNSLDSIIDRTKLLNNVVEYAIKNKKLTEIFGKRLGVYARDYRNSGLPIPRSLVILIGNRFRKNNEMLETIIPDKDAFIKEAKSWDRYGAGIYNNFMGKYLNFVEKHAIEGEYKYNPMMEKEYGRARKDIGAYNKSARYSMNNLFRGIARIGGKYETLQEVRNTIDFYSLLLEYGTKINMGLENITSRYKDTGYSVQRRIAGKASEVTDINTQLARNLLANSLVTQGNVFNANIMNYTKANLVVQESYGYRAELVDCGKLVEQFEAIRDLIDTELYIFLNEIKKEAERKEEEFSGRDREVAEEEDRRAKERMAQIERIKLERERNRLADAEREKTREEVKSAEEEKSKFSEELSNDKVVELKRLYDAHPDIDSGKGRNVAEAIMTHGKLYSQLSDKQAWRIDNELTYMKDKLGIVDVEEAEIVENRKHRLEDNEEIVQKVNLLIGLEGSAALKEVSKKFGVALDIAKTVKSKGIASDKQIRYIDKALAALAILKTV